MREGYVGRLAYLHDGLIVVVPVNYRLDRDGGALLRSGPGGKLEAARRGAPMSLEIDGVDDERHTGWSVCLVGVGEVVDPPALDVLEPPLPLRPWARGEPKDHWIRLVPVRVEGRSLRRSYDGGR